MLRKQSFAALAVVSALALVSACAGRGGAANSGSGGSGSGSGNGSGGSGSGSGSSSGGGTSGGGTSGGGTSGGGTSGDVDAGVVQQPTVSGLQLYAETPNCSQVTVGSSPVRRISRVEYNNMVRDLGLDPNNTQPANQFVAEQKVDNGKAGNFNTNAYATISGTLINQQYLQAAETLAAAAVASTNQLNSLLPGCSSQNAACAQSFITSFATKAFRGQLDSTESTNLNNLYTAVNAQFNDFTTGIQAVIEAVLTSPHFLFVIEFGQSSGGNANAVPLTPIELATRLALFFWRSIPDQTLLTAANNGQLATVANVVTQATRMLADSKAQSALQDFADQWLDIENMNAVTKDTSFTTWNAQVATDMHTESLTNYSEAVLKNSDYATLLTTPSSYINGDLASFYGVGGSPSFTTATNVNTSANPRTGILSNGAVLAMHAHTTLPSPTLRGRMIRQQILCEEVPDPPAAVGGVPIPPPPANITTGTTRGAYLTHVSANTACNSCHQYMDWLGFGFDNYNAAGLYITQENSTQVDPSGQFLPYPGATNDLSGTFTNMTDMVTQMSKATQVQQCFALQAFRYAILRADVDADACSVQQIYQAFTSNNLNLQQLLIAVVSSNSFMYRTPVSAGNACQ